MGKNNRSVRAFSILVHFFTVLCTTTARNDQMRLLTGVVKVMALLHSPTPHPSQNFHGIFRNLTNRIRISYSYTTQIILFIIMKYLMY